MKPPAPPLKPFRFWPRLLRLVALIILGFFGLLTACQHKLIYFPSPYQSGEPAAFIQRGGQRLDFTTKQGRQTAWLIPPRDGKPVERLWLVCAGNASTALAMDGYCRSLPFTGDAFLLADYPGYGDCEGSPHPDDIRDSLRQSLPLAAKALGLTEADLPGRTIVFGNSLGCAAGLIAADEFKLRRAVLCAPFTSTMEMAKVKLGLPLGFLVWHRFDNRARLAALSANRGKAWVFHGDADVIIPAAMSRTLAAEFPGTITLQEIPGAGHNNLIPRAHKRILAAMTAARGD